MIWFRNIVFWILFTISTLAFFVLFIFCAPLPRRTRHAVGVCWPHIFLWLLKNIIGLKYRVTGIENIPREPSIICSKHQSGYETLVLQLIFPHQVFVMKRELLYLPIVGWGLTLMNPIAINRSDRSRALQQLVEQGKARKEKGFWISIFPEGTRTKPGAHSQYKYGAARMAKALEMNIVPVALNSGEFWPRNSFLKYPGTVDFVVLPIIKHDSGTVEEIATAYENTIEETQKTINGRGPCFNA